MTTRRESLTKQTLLVFIGFTAILTVMLSATSLSLASLSRANQRLELLVKKHNVKSTLMNHMRDIIRERMLGVFTILTLQDPFLVEEEWERFTQKAGAFIIARDQLMALGLTAEELQKIEQQREALRIGQNSMNRVISLTRASDFARAREEVIRALTMNREIIDELADMIEIGQEVTQQEVKAASDNYRQTRRQMIWLDSFAVIICLLIIFFIVKRIRIQQQQLAQALDALQTANSTLEGRVLERTHDLLAVRDEALEASKAKSRFLANMSHELRTPLNAVIGYSEMLIDEAADQGWAQQCQDLEKIHIAGKHLLSLINDILDISKIEAGKMYLQPERFDLHHLVVEVVATMQPLIDQRHNQFILEFDAEIEEMYADPMRIRQILFNLLSNAVKFTEQGQIRVRIQRELRGDAPWLCCQVTDSGIGISPENQHKLFQAFSQVDGSSTRKYGGTGLGLAISLRFCQLMGGSIDVYSQLGQGCQFTVWLPQYISLREQDEDETDAMPAVL